MSFGFLFAGDDVDVFLGVGVFEMHVRQSLESFMSSGHAHEVTGLVWLILIKIFLSSCRFFSLPGCRKTKMGAMPIERTTMVWKVRLVYAMVDLDHHWKLTLSQGFQG